MGVIPACKMMAALTPDLASARVRDKSEALCGVPESIQATKEHERGKEASRGASVCKTLGNRRRPLLFWHCVCSRESKAAGTSLFDSSFTTAVDQQRSTAQLLRFLAFQHIGCRTRFLDGQRF